MRVLTPSITDGDILFFLTRTSQMFRKLHTVIDRSADFKEVLKDERSEMRKQKLPKQKDIFEPEYQSIQNYVEYLMQDGNDCYTAEDLEKLSLNMRTSSLKIIRECKINRGYRSVENKWASCPSHGGSGANQIIGFA